jgi:PST family polysaccharide transporter
MMLLYYTHGWIHLSLGKADRWFRWGMVEFAVTALLLWQGLRWGVAGVALAWVAAFWILTLPALWYAGKPVHLAIASFVAPVWRYVVASGLAGIASAVLVHATLGFAVPASAGAAFARIVSISVLFTTLYVAAVIALHRGCAPFHQISALLRGMLPLAKLPHSCAALASSSADPILNPTTVQPTGE